MASSLQNNPITKNTVSQNQFVLRVASRRTIGTLTTASPLLRQAETHHRTRLSVISTKAGSPKKIYSHKNHINRQFSQTPDRVPFFEIQVNQFQSRELGIQTHYSTHNKANVLLAPSIDETENSFLEKLNRHLLPFIDDADLDVSRICTLLKMSKTNLFMKLKAATGLSISLYVRRLKLIKGKQMLLSTNLTISEIAYQTGFNDPKYFTRVFSAEFGVSPKEMRVRG